MSIRVKAPRPAWRTCLLVLLVALAGCSYSFKGSLPPHLRTVSIPPIENQTAEFGVAEELTDKVLARFLRDGLLKVSAEATSDSRLTLTFLEIREAPFSYTQDEQTTQVRLTIRLKAEFWDKVEDRQLWSRELSEWGLFNPNGSPDRSDAVAQAAEKLVEAINQQMVADW